VIVTPAVDIRNGRCVQLIGGSFDHQVIELEDPVEVARSWELRGFNTLHVVDLDAATGAGSNTTIIERILTESIADVQVGGGLRSRTAVERMIDAGAQRVVLGTRALEDRAWLEKVVELYPERVVVAADVRDRALMTHGWKESIAKHVAEVVSSLNALPLAALLVTAVHKEGLMKGPDISLMSEVVQESSFPVQASGGIGSISDIRALEAIGVSRVIVGMALYTDSLTDAEIEEVFKS
jgi:phosphoribosylformimino-5-aminoimidazole carboxamide ribotide isomerase